MKNAFFYRCVPHTLVLLFSIVLISASVFAQDPHDLEQMKADFDMDKKEVSLDQEKYLSNVYYLNLEEMDFNSLDEADDYFSSLNTALVTFIMVPEKKHVIMTLQVRSQPRWDPEDWNTYLQTLK